MGTHGRCCMLQCSRAPMALASVLLRRSPGLRLAAPRLFCSGGTNVYKDGKGDIQLVKEEEAPEWLLSKLSTGEKATLEDLQAMDIDEMSEAQMRRMLKLVNKTDIKAENERKLL